MNTAKKEINGVFDGRNMVSEDGRLYPVPQNYASRTGLIEGDGLSLKVGEGKGIYYKQVKRAEREMQIGMIIEEDGLLKVECEGTIYNVLIANLRYHKAEAGKEAFIVVPKDKDAKWATIEMVIG